MLPSRQRLPDPLGFGAGGSLVLVGFPSTRWAADGQGRLGPRGLD